VNSNRPHLELTPRARADFRDCLSFVGQFPRGKPEERKRDIFRGMREVLVAPTLRRVEARRPRTGIDLRRHAAAQFVLIYAYFEPDLVYANGIVSIRAIRHRRVRNVFTGVQEPGLRGGAGLMLEDVLH
jgi:plasmid stabilization system protein ParE